MWQSRSLALLQIIGQRVRHATQQQPQHSSQQISKEDHSQTHSWSPCPASRRHAEQHKMIHIGAKTMFLRANTEWQLHRFIAQLRPLTTQTQRRPRRSTHEESPERNKSHTT